MGYEGTFDFPVLVAQSTRIPDKVEEQQRVFEGHRDLLPNFVAAARELSDRGAAAITTNCGFMALYQEDLASRVGMPVATSSLLLVPLVHQMLGPGRPIGILTYDERYLSEAHFLALGWSSEQIPVVVAGVQDRPHWQRLVIDLAKEKQSGAAILSLPALERELVEVARELVAVHSDLAALVLECTAFPPFASAVQAVVGRPVFDIALLTALLSAALNRRPYVACGEFRA
jgi:hypothetical protein